MRAMESSRQRLLQQLEEEQSDLHDPTSLVYDVASMPGFRFQPTEEELVGFYLRSMAVGNRLEVELINVLDLYRYDPWELPAMAFMQGEREWLFFCPRDKKYPNGARPNRVTASGYWKATGTDRQVRRSHDSRCIGLKKTLVFYTGKAPRGRKTEWIMNEYRLPQNELILRKSCARKDPREVALCRIYKKPVHNPALCTHATDSTTEDLGVESSTYYPYAESSKRRDRGAHESEPASASTSGTSPLPASPCRFTPCRRSIFHDDMDLLCDTQASCSRSVKLENETSLSSLRYNLAPDNVDDTIEATLLNAQLMHAETRRGRSIFSNPAPSEIRATTSSDVGVSLSISADRFSWLRQDDCCAHLTLPGEVAGLLDQPSCSNLSSIQSIDRLLKSSMFLPTASHSLLADENNAIDLPLSTSLFSSHSGTWSSHQPTWLQTISPARPTLLQIEAGRSQHSSE